MSIRESTGELVVLTAPAKLNLFLEVLGRRDDGFHAIYSLFQAVSLHDEISVSKTAAPGCNLTIANNRKLPTNDDNLIVKAYQLLRMKYGIDFGIDVTLTKRIPIAAGLGGGSSDAAAVLTALNQLGEFGLSRDQLGDVSLDLGSDLPFFFSSGQAVVRGRGEQITPIELPIDYWVLLVTPDFPVGTASAYAALKRGLTHVPERFTLPGWHSSTAFLEALATAANDFEPVVRADHPVIEEIAEALTTAGAIVARMSGSGPTMFGLFAQPPPDSLPEQVRRPGWSVSLVRPMRLTDS